MEIKSTNSNNLIESKNDRRVHARLNAGGIC